MLVCVWLWIYKRKELTSGAAGFMQRDLQANPEGKAGVCKLLASEEGRNRPGTGQEEAGLEMHLSHSHIATPDKLS